MSEKKPTLQRYDRPGHMHPAYAARLLAIARAGRGAADDEAFLRASAEEDDFASQWGESAVTGMTSGDAEFGNQLEARVDEEVGGPFVVTSTLDEFAEGIEASSPFDATGTEPRSFAEPEVDAPKAPRSWAEIYLPRARQIVASVGKHLIERVNPFTKAARRFARRAPQG